MKAIKGKPEGRLGLALEKSYLAGTTKRHGGTLGKEVYRSHDCKDDVIRWKDAGGDARRFRLMRGKKFSSERKKEEEGKIKRE